MDAREELRQALFASTDWQKCLRDRFDSVTATPPARGLAQEALLLARALEMIEPDRLFAVHMYVRAYKCSQQDPLPLVRARKLSQEIGNLEFAAKATRLQYVHTKDPRLLYLEGVTWLDAGNPERALQSLGMARQQLPSDDLVTIALATARQQWTDDGTVVAELQSRAAIAPGPEVGAMYLLFAARILRSAGAPEQDYGRMLLSAFAASPRDETVCSLLEAFLHRRKDQDGLVELYRRRVGAMTSAAEVVEEYRRAGTHLILDETFTGLGLRLLRRSVQCAIDARLDHVPGHIATHSVIRRYAEDARLLPEYLALVVGSLDLPVPGLDRLWLGLTGLDVAWNQLQVAETGYAYAAVVAHYAPEHPLLRAFHKTGGMAQGSHIADDEDSIYLSDWTEIPGDDDGELSLEDELAPEVSVTASAVVGEPNMAEIALDDIFELVAEQIEPIAPPDDGMSDEDVDLDFDLDMGSDAEPGERSVEISMDEVVHDERPMTLVPGEAIAALKQFRAKPPPLPTRVARPDAIERAPRVTVPADVRLHIGELRLNTVTRDVSATGMFLVTEADLDLDSDVVITARLPGTDDFAVLEYEVKARIVRKDEHGYGIEYVEAPAAFVIQISVLSAGY